MEKSNFLNRLKRERKLELVESSKEIQLSYLEKADNSLKSAKLLLNNNLYENSISMSYYAMYNSLTALLFKIGIKCENHSGSIILLENLFNASNLYQMISFAKEERIDKQYYVISQEELDKKSANDMFFRAENFLLEIRVLITKINSKDIQRYREKFKEL